MDRDSTTRTVRGTPEDFPSHLGKRLPAGIREALEHARLTHLQSQDVLYREGQGADTVFVITQGMVKLLSYLPNGRARIVRLYGPGSVIGLDGLIEQTYEHTAVVIGELSAYKVPVQHLAQLRESKPLEYAHILEFWHDYLRRADTWITEFSTGAIRARVARLLHFLSEIELHTGTEEVELLTCEDMAAILGVTPESVSRVLAEFKREKILEHSQDAPPELYRQDRAAVNDAAEE